MVYDIVQDHEGFLWFATIKGLYKYDGHSFTAVGYTDPDSTVHVDASVRDIFLSPSNVLWYGTYENVLGRLDMITLFEPLCGS
jgi:ligand-binding sensor domain-containing protein